MPVITGIKSPRRARLFSFFLPGAGHLYAGDPLRAGLVFALLVIGAVIAGAAGAIGVLVMAAAWLWGLFESPRLVRRHVYGPAAPAQLG